MTNADVIKALEDLKTYCSADSLSALEYAISVMSKIQKAGIEDPLNKDFIKK